MTSFLPPEREAEAKAQSDEVVVQLPCPSNAAKTSRGRAREKSTSV